MVGAVATPTRTESKLAEPLATAPLTPPLDHCAFATLGLKNVTTGTARIAAGNCHRTTGMLFATTG